MASTTTFTQLPLAIALGGGEFIPLDFPNGDGTFTTKRTSSSILSAFLGNLVQFGVLRSQVIAAAVLEFAIIGGSASLAQFISTQVSGADNPDATYIAFNHHPYAPINGQLYAMLGVYMQTILGISAPATLAHLTNIWAVAPTLVGGGTVTNTTPGITSTQFAAILAALPTTLPATAGQPWLNGGVLSVS